MFLRQVPVLLLGAAALTAQDGVPAADAEPHAEQAAPQAGGPDRLIVEEPAGILSISFDNDIFVGQDNNYTAGWTVRWISPELRDIPADRFDRRIAEAMGWLPAVCDERRATQVAIGLGQEMYTPEDIYSSPPPEDEMPYSGFLFAALDLFSRNEIDLHHFGVKLGVVGPASMAEYFQRWVHLWTGDPVPAGWDYQLSNEPVLNLYYDYARRLWRDAEPDRFGLDLSVFGGAGLGNYYTGANLGAQLVLGWGLPEVWQVNNLQRGGTPFLQLSERPGDAWQCYAFASAQGLGVARFMPTDGNTFSDSASVPREDFGASATAGVVLAHRDFALSYAINGLFDFRSVSSAEKQSYGTLTLSVFF